MPFNKTLNFRELGGLKTVDGRTVRHGIFYRSGMLAGFAADELDEVKKLGIRKILDFRSQSEALAKPDPEIPGADYCNICALYDENGEEMRFSPGDINHLFEDGVDMVAECDKIVDMMYADMAFDNAAFRRLFTEVENGDVPVLFHCSAGKDRTGVAAMLILFALGTDEKVALDDYELTNVYRKEAIDALFVRYQDKISANPDARMAFTMMEGVARRAGELVIDRIKQRYGGFERYFEAEYGLNHKKLERLREKYLE